MTPIDIIFISSVVIVLVGCIGYCFFVCRDIHKHQVERDQKTKAYQQQLDSRRADIQRRKHGSTMSTKELVEHYRREAKKPRRGNSTTDPLTATMHAVLLQDAAAQKTRNSKHTDSSDDNDRYSSGSSGGIFSGGSSSGSSDSGGSFGGGSSGD